MHVLLIDNYDSFTYNLVPLIAAAFGRQPLVVTNDSPEWASLDLSRFDAVVISPGPGSPAVSTDRGIAIDRVAAAGLPVLGVCFGHQALGWMCGATVTPASRARHGYVDRIRHTGTELFHGIPQDFAAVRYHSLCLLSPLPPDMQATAWAGDGVIMSFRHRSRPWWGVQFHPESVATEHGSALMSNFSELVARHRRRTENVSIRSRPRRIVCRQRLGFTVSTEILFEELFAGRPASFWLDSSMVERGLSRFSFLGDSGGRLGEVLSARSGTGSVRVFGGEYDTQHAEAKGSIFDVLRRHLRDAGTPSDPRVPFDVVGGYVGYFGYGMKAECGLSNRQTAPHPDALWMRATRLIAVDHRADQTWILALADGSEDGIREARQWLGKTAATVSALRGREPRPTPVVPTDDIDIDDYLDRPRSRYQDEIHRCRELLTAGESYEICLTDTLDVPFRGSPLAAYRRLRRANPAPYAAYMRFGDLHVLCSSPERFLTIDWQGAIESKPIKGTAPRGRTAQEDDVLRAALAEDPKSRAENLMIVDLLRNDLARVCRGGSVHVPSFMNVESYATVHQLVSTVRGRMRDGLDALDAVRTIFPGGSMTGAPKRRTVQILEEIEGRARGIYSGTLGYLGAHGTADLNIVIRTAVIDTALHRATIGAGGAIVLDSNPVAEFDEMMLKAATVARPILAEQDGVRRRRADQS